VIPKFLSVLCDALNVPAEFAPKCRRAIKQLTRFFRGFHRAFCTATHSAWNLCSSGTSQKSSHQSHEKNEAGATFPLVLAHVVRLCLLEEAPATLEETHL
jgi:hypothetical protein